MPTQAEETKTPQRDPFTARASIQEVPTAEKDNGFDDLMSKKVPTLS